MGRELRRVKLDFDWPIGKVWHGYLNPYRADECHHCSGSGYGPKAKSLYDQWYNWEEQHYRPNPFREGFRYNTKSWSNNVDQDDVQALIDAGRLMDFTRVPLTEDHREIVRKKREAGGNSWLPFSNGYIPTAKEVNEWNLKGIGHDSLNAHICVRAKAERLGYEVTCITCEGEGIAFQSEDVKKQHEEWEPFDPPKGDGFQLWGTTSEGNPMSPVFETLAELCTWLVDNEVSTFAKYTASYDEWFSMLEEDNIHHRQGNIVFL